MSKAEIVGEKYIANKVWQFMAGCILRLGTWKQINSEFWKYLCTLLSFKQNMHF